MQTELNRDKLKQGLKRRALTACVVSLFLFSCGQSTGSQGDNNEPVPPEPPTPYLSQTLGIVNVIDIEYNAVLSNINEATLTVMRYGAQIEEQIINTPTYQQTFEGMLKGDYTFILKNSQEGLSDIKEINIPNYLPSVNLGLVNTTLNEEEEKTIVLVSPQDKNPEDNPVSYVSAVSLDNKVVLGLEGSNLTVRGNIDETGTYQIGLEYGSFEGGVGSATLEGIINNLVDISGQLQDTETHLPQEGIIKIYNALDNTLLEEIPTDSLGYFDLQINQPVLNISLQARAVDLLGDYDSYIRTQKDLPGASDHLGLEVRTVTYPDPAQATPEDFKEHMKEVMSPISNVLPNPWLKRWDFGESPETTYPFNRVVISKNNPNGGGSFTDTEIENIKSKILDSEDIGSFFKGQITAGQIINNASAEGYSSPNFGEIVLYPDELPILSGNPVAGYARIKDFNVDGYIDFVEIVVRVPLDDRVLAHEFGHASGFRSHAITLPNIDPESSIMKSYPWITKPSEVDKKASKIIYERTYKPGKDIFNDFMGLLFLDE